MLSEANKTCKNWTRIGLSSSAHNAQQIYNSTFDRSCVVKFEQITKYKNKIVPLNTYIDADKKTWMFNFDGLTL